VLVVIPARGGSGRVARKNLRLVAGRSLLERTLDLLHAAAPELRAVVSTDDEEIAAVARAAGAEVVARPASLATAEASTESALLHALDELAATGADYEHVMTLPPTSPLRRPDTVRRFIDEARRDPEVDCLFSVHEDRGDYWVEESGTWTRLMADAPRRQQDRRPLYEENSAIDVCRTDALRQTGSILGTTRRAIVIDPIEGFDINVERDLFIAEALLQER
jgi:CMP-N,N'-diacetyllegionaminic acid synthase